MFYEKPQMIFDEMEDDDIITVSSLFTEEEEPKEDGEWSDWW